MRIRVPPRSASCIRVPPLNLQAHVRWTGFDRCSCLDALHHLESGLKEFGRRCQSLLVPVLGYLVRDHAAMIVFITFRILFGDHDVDCSDVGTLGARCDQPYLAVSGLFLLLWKQWQTYVLKEG